MNTGRHRTIAAMLLLALGFETALPPGGACATAEPDSTAATAGTVAIAAPPLAGAPPPAEIATLRERVDHHQVRVHLGPSAYDIRGARFDAAGVGFAPTDLRCVPGWDSGARGDDSFAVPAALASPIGWDRIDRIEVRKPCGTRGALVGGLVGTALYGTMVMLAPQSGGEVGMAALFGLVLVPLGALLGAGIGAGGRRGESVWERPGSGSPSVPQPLR